MALFVGCNTYGDSRAGRVFCIDEKRILYCFIRLNDSFFIYTLDKGNACDKPVSPGHNP